MKSCGVTKSTPAALLREPLFIGAVEFCKLARQPASPFTFDQKIDRGLKHATAIGITALPNPPVQLGYSLAVECDGNFPDHTLSMTIHPTSRQSVELMLTGQS
jgi:hypothetical protein